MMESDIKILIHFNLPQIKVENIELRRKNNVDLHLL